MCRLTTFLFTYYSARCSEQAEELSLHLEAEREAQLMQQFRAQQQQQQAAASILTMEVTAPPLAATQPSRIEIDARAREQVARANGARGRGGRGRGKRKRPPPLQAALRHAQGKAPRAPPGPAAGDPAVAKMTALFPNNPAMHSAVAGMVAAHTEQNKIEALLLDKSAGTVSPKIPVPVLDAATRQSLIQLYGAYVVDALDAAAARNISLRLPSPRTSEENAYTTLQFRGNDPLPDVAWQSPAPTERTCDNWFGNGFLTRVDVCTSTPTANHNTAFLSWLKTGRRSQILCWQHSRLGTSLCELRNVRIDGKRLAVRTLTFLGVSRLCVYFICPVCCVCVTSS
jgi:hypothetical protein